MLDFVNLNFFFLLSLSLSYFCFTGMNVKRKFAFVANLLRFCYCSKQTDPTSISLWKVKNSEKRFSVIKLRIKRHFKKRCNVVKSSMLTKHIIFCVIKFSCDYVHEISYRGMGKVHVTNENAFNMNYSIIWMLCIDTMSIHIYITRQSYGQLMEGDVKLFFSSIKCIRQEKMFCIKHLTWSCSIL